MQIIKQYYSEPFIMSCLCHYPNTYRIFAEAFIKALLYTVEGKMGTCVTGRLILISCLTHSRDATRLIVQQRFYYSGNLMGKGGENIKEDT